jgi:multidrug efflux pump subunit AcrB
MSMVVAFTITPWLAYHGLRRKHRAGGAETNGRHDLHDLGAVKQSVLYKIFYPLMAPLLSSPGK